MLGLVGRLACDSEAISATLDALLETATHTSDTKPSFTLEDVAATLDALLESARNTH